MRVLSSIRSYCDKYATNYKNISISTLF